MTPLPGWAGEYVGIRWVARGRDKKTGCDCWGLVWLVLTQQAGLSLDPFIVCPDDTNQQAELLAIQAQTGPWVEQPKYSGKQYDVALMNTFIRDGGAIRAVPAHVGILLTPERILHVEEGSRAVIVPYGPSERIARGNRIVSLWRWSG